MNNISNQGHDHNTELTFFDVGVGVQMRNPHISYIKTTVACGPHAKIDFQGVFYEPEDFNPR